MEHNYKQHYAINSKKELVHIYDATPETDTYYCIGCGEPMITKRGKIRAWHYAHKNNTLNCSYETYLHRVAKHRLCERFLQYDSFTISFRVPCRCIRMNNCHWADDSQICNWDTYTTFDLKAFYGECAEEQTYNGYRADVLLFNELEKYPPVFLEICVSHPCSNEKIESGVKIIELTVKHEKDIEDILKTAVFEESNIVKFHNFERYIMEREPARHKGICKFTLYENDKMFCSYPNCMTYLQHHPKAKLEVCVEQQFYLGYSMYDYGAFVALSLYPNLRTCNLCRYHEDRMLDDDWETAKEKRKYPIFCKLYKKMGTKRYCAPTEAKTCSYYKLYSQEQRQQISRQFDKSYIWQKDES